METPLIVVDPDIMLGKPIIASTRITVEKMVAGETIDQLLEEYPRLKERELLAVLSQTSQTTSRKLAVKDKEK